MNEKDINCLIEFTGKATETTTGKPIDLEESINAFGITLDDKQLLDWLSKTEESVSAGVWTEHECEAGISDELVRGYLVGKLSVPESSQEDSTAEMLKASDLLGLTHWSKRDINPNCPTFFV